MKVLVTGANGFIGKNLITKLNELKKYEVISIDIDNTKENTLSNTINNNEIDIPKEEIYIDNNIVKIALYQGKNKAWIYIITKT